MCDSLTRLGLRTPITVRTGGEDGYDVVLVTGLHRLKAAEKLGWQWIEAVYIEGDEADARLWEIAENLHRAELSPVERAEHIAEWVRLTDMKTAGASCAGSLADGRRAGPQHQPGGINAASRDLGIDRTQAQRAVKIAGLPQEVRDQAREEGWSQKRLLEAAAPAPAPAPAPARPVPPAPPPRNSAETEEAWITSMMKVWNRGSKEWREEFLRRVDEPVMDRRYGGSP